jgi:hypothetical protein
MKYVRGSLMRSREFIMKDLYSLMWMRRARYSYRKMYHAYSRIYDRMAWNTASWKPIVEPSEEIPAMSLLYLPQREIGHRVL